MDDTQRTTYHTLTEQDALDLRVARVRELERMHYGIRLQAEEAGQYTPELDRERHDLERRIDLHVMAMRRDEAHGPEQSADEQQPGPPEQPDAPGPVGEGLAPTLGHQVDHDLDAHPAEAPGVIVYEVDEDAGRGGHHRDDDRDGVADGAADYSAVADDAQAEAIHHDHDHDHEFTYQHGGGAFDRVGAFRAE